MPAFIPGHETRVSPVGEEGRERDTMARQDDTFGQVLKGIKGAFGLFFALPFLVFLVPMWFLYRWNERRCGRPDPESPLAGVPLASLFSASAPEPEPLFRVPASMASEASEAVLERPVDRGRHARHASASPASVPHDDRQAATLHPLSFTSTHVTPPPAGQVALVTGGAKHIGAALCRDLAHLGYRVAVTYYRSQTEAEALVAAIQTRGGEAKPFFFDATQPDQVTALLDGVEEALGVPDLLINNASLFSPTHLQASTWEELELLCRVNLQGPMWLAMRVAERMQRPRFGEKRGGHMIQLCDIWGARPLAGHTVYSATKAGLIMATRALARDMAPTIRVNAIAPGAVLAHAPGTEDARFQRMLSRTPLSQHAGPEAVLQAVRYLLTAHFVTGEILYVDGGRHLV